MRSIMQDADECYVCGSTYWLEEHHVIYGTGKRQLSEKYGLKVKLCKRHHTGDMTGNKAAVHFNKTLDTKIKREAQKAFERTYPDLNFLKVFGRNYL